MTDPRLPVPTYTQWVIGWSIAAAIVVTITYTGVKIASDPPEPAPAPAPAAVTTGTLPIHRVPWLPQECVDTLNTAAEYIGLDPATDRSRLEALRIIYERSATDCESTLNP